MRTTRFATSKIPSLISISLWPKMTATTSSNVRLWIVGLHLLFCRWIVLTAVPRCHSWHRDAATPWLRSRNSAITSRNIGRWTAPTNPRVSQPQGERSSCHPILRTLPRPWYSGSSSDWRERRHQRRFSRQSGQIHSVVLIYVRSWQVTRHHPCQLGTAAMVTSAQKGAESNELV